jgi:DNA-binding IclR family transcriptional regulator
VCVNIYAVVFHCFGKPGQLSSGLGRLADDRADQSVASAPASKAETRARFRTTTLDTEGMEQRIPIKTTETVFEIVEALIERDGAQFTTLVDDLDMARSTVHDHLRTLESLGWVIKRDEEYTVSTRFLEVGEQMRRQRRIYKAAHEEIKNLATETGEHATLMIEENGLGVFLYVEKGEQAVDINAYAGRRLPLPAHAPGKAILAHFSEERVETILDEHGLPEYTSKTITDAEELREELEQVRERGYAVDEGELVEGVQSISAPIRSQGRTWGSLTVGGPANRMQGDRFDEDLPDLLMRAANVIELNLTNY